MAEGDFNTAILGHLGQVRPNSGKKYMVRAVVGPTAGSGIEVRIGSRGNYASGVVPGIVLDNTNFLEYHNTQTSPR